MIKVKGVLIPKISNISIEKEDIKKITIVKLRTKNRFNLVGTNDLKTWWCFDKFRFLKGKGIVIELNKKIGPINKIGFTVTDLDAAIQVLRSNGQDVYYEN